MKDKRNPYYDMDTLDLPYEPLIRKDSVKSKNKYLNDLENWKQCIKDRFMRCFVSDAELANTTPNLEDSLPPCLKGRKSYLDEFFLDYCIYREDSVNGEFRNFEFKEVFHNDIELYQFFLSLLKFMSTPYIDTSKSGMMSTVRAMARMNPNLYDVRKFFNSDYIMNILEFDKFGTMDEFCEKEFLYYSIMEKYLTKICSPKDLDRLFKDKVLILDAPQLKTTISYYVASFNTVVKMEWNHTATSSIGVGTILWMDYAQIINPMTFPTVYEIPVKSIIHNEEKL